jgi:hypothetical protein
MTFLIFSNETCELSKVTVDSPDTFESNFSIPFNFLTAEPTVFVQCSHVYPFIINDTVFKFSGLVESLFP